MAEWPEKLKILKEKSKLRGKDIYIDSEVTYKERNVQKRIRVIAREERTKRDERCMPSMRQSKTTIGEAQGF